MLMQQLSYCTSADSYGIIVHLINTTRLLAIDCATISMCVNHPTPPVIKIKKIRLPNHHKKPSASPSAIISLSAHRVCENAPVTPLEVTPPRASALSQSILALAETDAATSQIPTLVI